MTAPTLGFVDPRPKRSCCRVLLIAAAILVALPVLFLLQPMGTGSPRVARRWLERLNHVATPADAAAYPELRTRTFADGSWVIGFCDDSHLSMFGGTMVTKDSRGDARAWFGHICGPAYLDLVAPQGAADLAAFYAGVARVGLKPHVPEH